MSPTPRHASTPDSTPATPGGTLPGVLVGHDTDSRRPTGVTVILLPEGSTGAVAVRGAAPGTRETDLLEPGNTVQHVDAFALCGGSAFGLDAVGGVLQWLEGRGRGLAVGPARVPIVPAAVLFDLWVGDHRVRPDADSGRRACDAAVTLDEAMQSDGAMQSGGAMQGNVGAGAGATVGKLLGPHLAMRGGLGIATRRAHGLTVCAVVAVNAVGDVVGPDGTALAGARTAPDGLHLAGSVDAMLNTPPGTGPTGNPGGNTTVGVVITDATLSKAQAGRLAQVAHDGLARTIRPVHTSMDGDTMFAAATGTADETVQDALPPDALGILLPVMAAEATAEAVVRAIRAARGIRVGELWLPAWSDRAGADGAET